MVDLPYSQEELERAFPKYRIVDRPLGVGGFKSAHLVRPLSTEDEQRVLKVVYLFNHNDRGFDPDTPGVARIRREIDVMAEGISRHIVSLIKKPEIVDIGQGRYLCYEEPYYSGGTLSERLSAGPLSADECRVLLVTLLTAVVELWNHSQIVHRDIKPDNIVYSDSGLPILLDFGIALFTQSATLTDSGAVSPRTNLYAAPEQFELRRDVGVDFRTDHYAIGLTVHESITGKHPFYFPGIDSNEYFRRMSTFKSSNLDSLINDRELREVLARLLSPRKYGRFKSPDIPLAMLGVM